MSNENFNRWSAGLNFEDAAVRELGKMEPGMPRRRVTIDISIGWALVFVLIVAVIGAAAWVAVLVGAL